MKRLFTQSNNIKKEYCATIVKVGEVKPIEGADRLASTLINGFSVVIDKNSVKEGDIMFYCANETMLNETFLSVNNQYDMENREKNANADLVEALLAEQKRDEAKRLVGYFNKYGRVKMIRLKGVPSYGYLISVESMRKYCPAVDKVDLESLVGYDFDTVDGELFIKVFIPPVKVRESSSHRNERKRQKKVERFDRLIPGEFEFHYDTDQLNREICKLNPTDSITISVKEHGTSAIFSNEHVRVPHEFKTKFGFLNKVLDFMYYTFVPKKYRSFTIDWGLVYSSRGVIKNKFINPLQKQGGFYGTDIWGEYADIIGPYVPKGFTLYGEIVGYITGDKNKMIQKNYDYGCAPGTNKLMIYRITSTNPDGSKHEWNVPEVYAWTEQLIDMYPVLKYRVKPITILYVGQFADLYPELDIKNHWHENVLEALKNDKTRLGMEMTEPLCEKTVPREGIVIRVNNNTKAAYKLKTDAFFERERKLIDAGEVDMEMENNVSYGDEENVNS